MTVSIQREQHDRHALSSPPSPAETACSELNVRERRKAMLVDPYMVELTSFAEKLRRPGLEVPDFDPRDGGEGASVVPV